MKTPTAPRSEPGHLNSVWLVGTVEEPEEAAEPPGPSALRFALRGDHSVFLVEAPLRALEGRREDFRPGTMVRIIGRLRQQRWRNAEGSPRAQILIIGELVEPIQER